MLGVLKMKKKNLIGTFSLIFLGIVFGAVLVSGFGLVRPGYGSVRIGADKPPVEQLNADASAFNNAFIEVADKVTQSIVQVEVVATVKNKMSLPEGFQFFNFQFKDDQPQEQEGGGSGIIISEDGFILTNNHVVENAKQITVKLHDKREFEATVVGNDPTTDLAVIKVDAKNLPAAYFGDSDKLKVGQWVMAIGNPLSLTSTVTAGIISAVKRDIRINSDSYAVRNYIQTDAVINPGNSGGALVDLNGAVIGVNAAIATNGMTQSYIGYGFAIPINLAKTVANDLITNGKVSRGYIGVEISEVNAATAKAVGLGEPHGVLVQKLVKGGSAENADVKEGDIILKVDGQAVNQPNELQSAVASKRAGTVVKLDIFRDGKQFETNVTLKARDDSDSKTIVTADKSKKGKSVDSKEMTLDALGLTVKNLDNDELERYKVKSGVLVTNVKNFSKAYDATIINGVVITTVNKKEVNSVSELKSMLDKKKGEAVMLKIVDGEGTSRLVPLEIPK
jgi:serine protease Do